MKKMTFGKAIERTREKIESGEFLNLARKRIRDFTRNRKMPFDKLIYFMLNMIKASTQTCLDRFFEMIGQEDTHMTQQSFSEARQKLNWEAFQYLFKMIVREIYSCEYETWNNYRVSAIDGSKIQLPDDDKIREHFGTIGKGSTAATAQSSSLYDVYNNVLIDVQIKPMSVGERNIALMHIEELYNLESFKKECIIFDRGYASFNLIEDLKGKGIDFVMRVRSKFNIYIDDLPEGDHFAVLQKKGHDDINVRVLKFPLPSGEIETLISSIMDKSMDIQEFKGLYFKRWPIETKFNEIKNKLEVENFSGRTVDAIMQDFFITMYLSNMAAIACWDAQADVDEARKYKDNKYEYHVNVNHAVGTLKDRFIMALLEPRKRIRNKKINQIMQLLKEHVVPYRPDRSKPRNKWPRKAKFFHNKKSNC